MDTFNDPLVSTGKDEKKINLKKMILIIVLAAVGVVALIAIILVLALRKKDKDEPDTGLEFDITTVELPSQYMDMEAHYSPEGRIIVQYKERNNESNQYFGIMNDDGSNLQEIYSGKVVPSPRANGIRIIPFFDNKRFTLGDYIMECTPSLDNCESSKLLPIIYPPEVVNNNDTMFIWSEIIISQDNEHIAWTTLHMVLGAVNFIGRLKRLDDAYEIVDAKIISSIDALKIDPEHPGYLIASPMRGGEIKQFVHGGTAATLVGAGSSGIATSVLQDFKTPDITVLSQEPGYEETTIMSPDEKLGTVMSTRFSPKTNCAIIGLLPRPNSIFMTMGMNRFTYDYSVTGVRDFREGNVGPALVEIEKAINDKDYHGYDLHDTTGEWIYSSPMSWHKSSTKSLWQEIRKGTDNKGEKRIRRLTLHNYKPGDAVPAQKTPEDIPYALNISEVFNIPTPLVSGKIAGVSGYIDYNRTQAGIVGVYVNYSVDGKVFYNGYENFTSIGYTGAKYYGKVEMTGADQGSMDFKLTFDKDSSNKLKLLKGDDPDDQKPYSYGYSTYAGKTVSVDQMVE